MSQTPLFRQAYVVCATQRSGSFLLLEALKNTGLACHPEEYFLDAQAGWAARYRQMKWGANV